MKKLKGFSIVEVIILIAIVVIIVFVAMPKFNMLIRRSNEGMTRGNLASLRSAISIYYGENDGNFPGNNIAEVLVNDEGKYIDSIPFAYCPPYHHRNNVILTGIDFPTESANTGGWGYKDSDNGTGRNWGEIWINCTHTDSRGIIFSEY